MSSPSTGGFATDASTSTFTCLAHARTVIETWRREYKEERPKKSLGGLTPAAYARTPITETGKVTAGL